MVKKLDSTPESKGFFANERGGSYWHCSVPLSWVLGQHSEVGVRAQLECWKMQGLNWWTKSFPDCKFPCNSQFAGNISSLGLTMLSSQYIPFEILRNLSGILANQHLFVMNSKCFTSALFLLCLVGFVGAFLFGFLIWFFFWCLFVFTNSNRQLGFIALIWNIQQAPENVLCRNVLISTTRSLFRSFKGTDHNERFTVRTCSEFFLTQLIW